MKNSTSTIIIFIISIIALFLSYYYFNISTWKSLPCEENNWCWLWNSVIQLGEYLLYVIIFWITFIISLITSLVYLFRIIKNYSKSLKESAKNNNISKNNN